MPGGWIDNRTDQWKPINYINETLINNKKNYNHKFIVLNGNSKSINIDSLHCPPNSVVTGKISIFFFFFHVQTQFKKLIYNFFF